MTIASDFYDYLRGTLQAEPGTEGRKLHSRIAELEEVHATLRSGFETVVDEKSLLAGRHADLRREHAELRGEASSLAIRYFERGQRLAMLEVEHVAMTRELAPKRLGRSIALDDAARREVARRQRDGEPPISFDDIRAEYERTIGK